MKSARVAFVILFVLAVFALSQVASATPVLWLKADSGALHYGVQATDGQTVSAWTDYGSSHSNAVGGGTSAPTFVAGVAGTLNGMPTLNFSTSGGNRYLVTTASFTQPCTVLTVYKGGSGASYLMDGANGTNRLWLIGSYSGGNMRMSGPDTGVAPSVLTSAYGVNEATFAPSGGASFSQNGTTLWNNGTTSGSASTGLTIGARYDGTDSGLNGNIAEFMVFTGTNNFAERSIALNYLGAKYNIARTGRNYYGGDSSGNGEYDFHVTGIGYESASDKITSTPGSGSSSGLILAENTPLNTAGQYLLAGDKNTANTWVTTNLSSGWQRWARDWYVQKTGSLDGKLTFDFGDAGGVTYDSGKTYKLLYRNSSSGTFSDTGLTGTFGSIDEISFTVADGTLQTGYYTLGERLVVDLTVIAFNDNGAGIGGVAGDGIQNGSEPGLSGWGFTAAGQTLTTGLDGSFTISGVGSPGDSVTISQDLVNYPEPGWTATTYPLHTETITLRAENIVRFGNTYAGSPIPEPAALGLIGLALLAIRRRRS